MEASGGFIPLGAQVSATQHLEDRISQVGKSQIGNGVDLPGGSVHLKIVFHGVPFFLPIQ